MNPESSKWLDHWLDPLIPLTSNQSLIQESDSHSSRGKRESRQHAAENTWVSQAHILFNSWSYHYTGQDSLTVKFNLRAPRSLAWLECANKHSSDWMMDQRKMLRRMFCRYRSTKRYFTFIMTDEVTLPERQREDKKKVMGIFAPSCDGGVIH